MDIIFDPQMTIGDMNALDQFAQGLQPNLAIEVGSWKGLSTWILSKHSGIVYCVDTWQAADSTPNMKEEAGLRDIFTIFRNNLTQLQLYQKVKPMVMTSAAAARVVKDGCADLVFIDADHIYSSVFEDIMLWLPKVRPGGILCGHDCEILWRDCTQAMKDGIDKNLTIDYIQNALGDGRGIHPGVTRAIHNIFNDEVTVLPKSSIWWVKK
jgi:hypothetical protein